MEKFNSIRKEYSNFNYLEYKIIDNKDVIKLEFIYETEGLDKFNHIVEIEKKNIVNFRSFEAFKKEYENIVFNLGMLEIINYVKLTCSKNINIFCGSLNNYQIEWFKDIYYNGLGEFRYINNIVCSKEDFFNINIKNGNKFEKNIRLEKEYINNGVLIPIGGGKDSVVTIELLKNMKCSYTIVNKRGATISCLDRIDSTNEKNINVYRKIDEKLLGYNKDFLNGHVPFSAMLAFLTYFIAFISSHKYIALSNESSASEPNIPGTNINHQYSKSFKFENDFRNYTKKYMPYNIEYFSFLRPINELQIAKLFSKFKKYHSVFKSCNKGSKEDIWCCECPKCLFVYIMLNIYLSESELIQIFGENILEKKELLECFLELCGKSANKPFECVGTFEEVNYAVCKYINENTKLPYLLNYYKEKFDYSIKQNNLENNYSKDNNLDRQFEEILKGEIFNDSRNN